MSRKEREGKKRGEEYRKGRIDNHEQALQKIIELREEMDRRHNATKPFNRQEIVEKLEENKSQGGESSSSVAQRLLRKNINRAREND